MQLKVKSKSDGRRTTRAAKLKILLYVQVPFTHQLTNTLGRNAIRQGL